MAQDRTTVDGRSPELRALGRRVRSRRDEHDWGVVTLAQRAGLHWTYVREIEQGKRNISVLTLHKLARALEVDPCLLLRDVAPSSTPPRRRS
jgi:transcriptional regulator with XRE-family HTH domain